MYPLGGIGLRSWLIRPGATGATSPADPASALPDEYEYLVDHNGNNLVDHKGNLLITSNGYYRLKDHNGNLLVDQHGNYLVAYLKNRNF